MTKSLQPKYMALLAATGLLLINFWAWSLLSPLASTYGKEFALSPFAVSLLVAAPMLLGSFGRIPGGLLADKYGGRKTFAFISMLSGFWVISLALSHSYTSVLSSALGLGIAGASFAVGVPFVSAWFPRKERGFALGVYAIGNAGTAVAGLLTPRLIELSDRTVFFMVFAAMLIGVGVLMALRGRNAPDWHPATVPMAVRLKDAASWRLTWVLSLLYAITFGAFVALGLYLPVLLTQSYGLAPTDAAMRASGFVLLGTALRPIGGLLSDRFGGESVIRYTFLAIFGLVVCASLTLPLIPLGTFVYLGLAGVVGAGNGAVFAILGHSCDEKRIGTVGGIVGAAGCLGGFFPPLLMGISYQTFGSYAPAFALLAIVALAIYAILPRLLGKKRENVPAHAAAS